MNRALWPAALLLSLSAHALTGGIPAFEAGRAGFSIRYKDEASPYKVNAAFLMPGEILQVRIPDEDKGRYAMEADTAQGPSLPPGPIDSAGPRAWKWKAPDSAGLYRFSIRRDSSADTVFLNAFVMVPISEMKGEYLRGYHIGAYPRSPLKGLDFYRTPKGFIKLDQASARARVSPHFLLGQFACKQSTALPAYLFIKERLILKLELVLEKANRAGYACNTFHVMSGYRTPYYNHLIGNVKHSAHQFGGAADIFIDASPEDGEMDDLNGDGKSDGADSDLLFNLVDAMAPMEIFLPYLGGLGKYDKSQSHGAFVHVDVRGFRAVW